MGRALSASGRPRTAAVSPARRRRFRAAVTLGLVVCLGYGVVLAAQLGTAAQRHALSDAIFVVAPAVAAWSCWSASRRDSAWRSGWRWITAGCLTWATGSLIWAVIELGFGDTAPFPSPADIAYIGYAIPITVGLIRFPAWTGSALSRLRLGLDAVVIAAGLLYVSGVWVMQPVISGTDGSTLVRIDALLYPIGDVTVAAVVLTRCLAFSSTRRLGWSLLSLGLLVLTVTDSSYVARTYTHSYSPGHVLDLGWLLSFVMVAVAAQVPIGRSTHGESVPAGPAGLVQQLLPYVPVALAAGVLSDDVEVVHRHGAWFWATCALGAMVAIRQLVVVADHVALNRNLSAAVERRTAELSRREQWWKDVVRNLSDVVIVLDRRGAVRYCSPSVQTALGHQVADLRNAAQLLAQLHPDDVAGVTATVTPVVIGDRRHGFVECRLRRADGNWGWFELTAGGQPGAEALDGAVLTLHDITERRRLTERLSHQAFHDALTGLPNRALLMQRIEAALPAVAAAPFALLLIDLDDFKLINDRHGHGAGDLVLVAIAKRLRRAVRAGDLVARLGGDEFAIGMRSSAEHAVATARRIAETIQRPVQAGGRTFMVRASVGVVFAATDGTETPDTLLSHADIALYEAKAHGRGGVIVIDGADRERAANHVYLREQVSQPELDQFHVVYQPVVDLADGRVRGVEALLRWQHPRLGEVPPGVFIPLAEQGGSIRTLGWFVLEEACRQLAQWTLLAPDHRLAAGVNVSVLHLDEPGFADRVVQLIDQHGLQRDQLVLELTEQALARDFEIAVEVVAVLRAAGVSVAVDDFGTGYSSLRYLHRFAADVVKIDRSFISHLQESEHTQKLVRSVVQMAESLDLQCIAEGIETTEQLALVRELGCELAQGYLFSRPVPAGRISDLLLAGVDFSVRAAPSDSAAPRPPATTSARPTRPADPAGCGSGTARSAALAG